MTKKHFIAIAAILKNERRKALSDQDFTSKIKKIVINNITSQLIDLFINENPNFDINKFIDASNLTEEEMRLPLWLQKKTK